MAVIGTKTVGLRFKDCYTHTHTPQRVCVCLSVWCLAWNRDIWGKK